MLALALLLSLGAEAVGTDDAGAGRLRLELVVVPISGQLNGYDPHSETTSEHTGAEFVAVYHPQPRFGLRLRAHSNWQTSARGGASGRRSSCERRRRRPRR